MAMIVDEARESSSRATSYKRDRSNAYGTLDLSGLAYLLIREGVQPQVARWYQRYRQQVRVISIMVSGLSGLGCSRSGSSKAALGVRGCTCIRRRSTWRRWDQRTPGSRPS